MPTIPHSPMATFLHRKSLLTQPTVAGAGDHFPSHCYMCYICPQDCYTIRSPPSVPSPSPSNGPNLSTFLVLMLCLLILAFLVLTYLTIRRYRASLLNPPRSRGADIWNRVLVDHGHHPAWFIRTVGLPQSTIDSIPVFEFGKVEGGTITDCSVCLSEFRDEERVKILPECGHRFHVVCIDPWLRFHTNCPICRAPIGRENVRPVEENPGEGDGLQIRPGTGIEESTGEIIQGSDIENAEGCLGGRVFGGRRRALSMEFSSEFMIGGTVEKPNRRKPGCRNSSGRFLQKGPVSMKRSLSFGGKGWKLRKSRRNHDSTGS